MMPEAAARSGDVALDMRRRSWRRVGIGLGLIVILLGVLAALEPGSERGRRAAPDSAGASAEPPDPAPSAAAAPAPGGEPPQEPAGEPSEPLIGVAVALPEPPAAADVADEGAEPADAKAEGGQAQAASPTKTPASADVASKPAEPAPASVAQAAPAAPVKQIPVEAVAPGKKGYLVQLGVFGVSGNAEALLAELQRRGVPGRLETRVVAGPFGSRKNAEAAGASLRKEGFAKGIVIRER